MIYKIDSITDYGVFSLLTKDEAGNNYRRTYAPGDNFSDLPEDIQEQIRKIWTSDVIAAYKKILDSKDKLYKVTLDNTDIKSPSLEERVIKLESAIDTIQAAQVEIISEFRSMYTSISKSS